MVQPRERTDVLVVGTGAAGLATALEAAKNAEVVILTKASGKASATAWAQGGIAAVLHPDDTFADHADDTRSVGAGLAAPDIVAGVVEEAPASIQALVDMGANFSTQSTDSSALDLTREGGHSARRIVHADDFTRQEIHRVLWEQVVAHPRISVRQNRMAIDLILKDRGAVGTPVRGVYALDTSTGTVETWLAGATVLATGGAGKVYRYTSNPDVATGDGIAMAYRAGAAVRNMEFFQFHPTCLYHPKAKNFLISEALRGEGATLRLPSGEPFMSQYDARAELAPRDVVARAIDAEIKRHGLTHVHLDLTHKPAAFIRDRFPNIFERCLSFGIDITQQPIPVVPAAHYLCGGVAVSENGQTQLENLWAVGEVAHTGLHGANRLASNSLLESLVYAHRCGRALATSRSPSPDNASPWDVGSAVPSDEAIVVHHNWDEVRSAMWNYVGIVRSNKRLERAERRVAMLRQEIRDYYFSHLVDQNLLELRNIALVAELVITCAKARQESRGLHYNIDYPNRDDAHFCKDTEVAKSSALRFVKPGPA